MVFNASKVNKVMCGEEDEEVKKRENKSSLAQMEDCIK